ncbi:hypothetical protein Ferp_1989 [Ferroglobus placidus DSM 10642]|uniref:Uncharacterized protein n=1 Tax=Ferroglobus placidus (strain DSM 10642 / AEDII12DO) TaxID=589924 RepID=D3S063_FERPA|nr:hypothetical protein Ferp_1989 [Ferroglobus placidus DSM 10642]
MKDLKSVEEGSRKNFGALSVEFGERSKSREKSNETRILARKVVYCIKLALRWKCELLKLLDTPDEFELLLYVFHSISLTLKPSSLEKNLTSSEESTTITIFPHAGSCKSAFRRFHVFQNFFPLFQFFLYLYLPYKLFKEFPYLFAHV